jgi:hypothetical protein
MKLTVKLSLVYHRRHGLMFVEVGGWLVGEIY